MTRKSRTARDTGLRQVKTATKVLAGTAAVLTGFFAVWEARSVHEAAATTPTPAATQSPSPSTTQPAPSDPGSSTGDLQAPDYAPAPSYQPPAASSGGS